MSYYGAGNPYQQQGAHSGGTASDGASFYSQNGGYSQQQRPQQTGGFGSNPNAYGSQQSQQQSNQQQWSQQQPSQQQTQAQAAPAAAAPSLWNPTTASAAAAVMAAATQDENAMINVGKSFLKSGTARMVPGLESLMTTLRTYFAVDNRYVTNKIQRVLFPYRKSQWKRTEAVVTAEEVRYALPHGDVNAPDLYLPVMSMITYVLLCALCYGTAGKFNPEIMGNMTTKCILTQLLEVSCIRFGFYMLQAEVPFLDLVSYTGYKYVGLCVNMWIGVLLGFFGFGYRSYYITFLWTSSADSFFMLKTMANTIPKETAASGPKREMMVLGFCLSQFATMWFLSQTKFLT